MTKLTKTITTIAIGAALATACYAETALTHATGTTHAATPYLPVASEPAARLIVEAPLAEPLARGAVLIPYRTENIRVLPVFGAAAADLSPRAGHLHVTVDNLPWHWADASGTNTVVVVGLPTGEHTIRLELADTEHRVITGETVTFRVPVQAH